MNLATFTAEYTVRFYDVDVGVKIDPGRVQREWLDRCAKKQIDRGDYTQFCRWFDEIYIPNEVLWLAEPCDPEIEDGPEAEDLWPKGLFAELIEDDNPRPGKGQLDVFGGEVG